jgi:hypothetical protein
MLLLHNFRALILLILSTNLLPTCRAVLYNPLGGCYKEGETCESVTGRWSYSQQTVTRVIASCPDGDTTRVLLSCQPRRKLVSVFFFVRTTREEDLQPFLYAKVYNICILFSHSGEVDCIATPCTPKTSNRPPSDDQCGTILAKDKGYPDSQHSINVFQQSCSVDGVSDADDGENSVCCKPEAKDGMHPLTLNVQSVYQHNIVSNDSKQKLDFFTRRGFVGWLWSRIPRVSPPSLHRCKETGDYTLH